MSFIADYVTQARAATALASRLKLASSSSSVPVATRRPPSISRIWSARRSATGRCDTTRHVTSLPAREQARPQLGLRLGVERRREVVEHEQLGVADEHPRGGGALHLAAGQLHAARADRACRARARAPATSGSSTAAWIAASSAAGIVRTAEQQVLAQRLAEQPRHLRRVGAAGRDEERRRVVDDAPFQRISPASRGSRPSSACSERRLPGADPSGDDGERAALERERDVGDPTDVVAPVVVA